MPVTKMTFKMYAEKQHSVVYKHPDWNGGVYVPKFTVLKHTKDGWPKEITITIEQEDSEG